MSDRKCLKAMSWNHLVHCAIVFHEVIVENRQARHEFPADKHRMNKMNGFDILILDIRQCLSLTDLEALV